MLVTKKRMRRMTNLEDLRIKTWRYFALSTRIVPRDIISRRHQSLMTEKCRVSERLRTDTFVHGCLIYKQTGRQFKRRQDLASCKSQLPYHARSRIRCRAPRLKQVAQLSRERRFSSAIQRARIRKDSRIAWYVFNTVRDMKFSNGGKSHTDAYDG